MLGDVEIIIPVSGNAPRNFGEKFLSKGKVLLASVIVAGIVVACSGPAIASSVGIVPEVVAQSETLNSQAESSQEGLPNGIEEVDVGEMGVESAYVEPEQSPAPKVTPVEEIAEAPEVDFSFTLAEIGHPNPLEGKIVPFEDDGIMRNFAYMVTSSEWNWSYLSIAEPQTLRARTFTSFLKSEIRDAPEGSVSEESQDWINSLDTDTRDWLNALMEFANEKRFRYSDNTLQWVLVYTEYSGEPELYSPLDILTIKTGSKYTFLTKDEFGNAPEEFWDDIEKGLRYLDINRPREY